MTNRWKKFTALFRRKQLDAEMAEEMRLHLEQRVEENVAAGISAEEARYAARREFGGIEQVKELAREQRAWAWLDEISRDLRQGVRTLAKSRSFTAIAVLSLALGIGTNTAVFSVTNAVLLAQLPVKDPDQLVLFNWLAEENVYPQSSNGWRAKEPGSNKVTSTSFSIPTFEAFQKQGGGLSEVFAFHPVGALNVMVDGAAEMVPDTQVASGNYHIGLGVAAAAGRLFTPEDDQPGSQPVAVISHDYWQRRFGGDAGAVGKSISVNGIPVMLIGVTVPSFRGTLQVGEVVDLTLPLGLEGRLNRIPDDSRRAGRWWVRIMGRLKNGATAEQARASLEGIFQETARGAVLLRTVNATVADPKRVPLPQLRVEPGGQGLYEARRNYQSSLNLLMAVAGLVLLIACANVANLLLARGAARRREIAVRLALGASRTRIVGLLLAESMLLAALGAALGLGFAVWGARALIAMQPFGSATLQFELALDWHVLGFASACALATGVVFGLVPALRAARLDLRDEFQGGPRAFGAGSRSWLAKSLMVVQVALSLMLLVGAGLFVRTLRNLQHVDVGFNQEQLLLFQVNARPGGATGQQALATYERLRERLAAIPGVQRVSYGRIALLSQNNSTSFIYVPGFVLKDLADNNARMNGVEPGYLAAMGIPVLRGRDFGGREAASDGPKVAIVNQSFAKKYFGSEDVIGRRFGTRLSSTEPEIEIIGVVRDSPYANVKTPVEPVVLFPYTQLDPNSVGPANFVIRFAGAPEMVAGSVRIAAREVDPNLPVTNLRTQEQQIHRLFAQERLFAKLCSVFGLVALVLVAVGLYGLMAYAVQRRTNEIGLRMALGAVPSQVLRMILGESLALVAVGIGLGLGIAYAASRLVASMLFALSPTDPVTYATGAMMVMSVALIASLLPARRAANVDPVVALRAE